MEYPVIETSVKVGMCEEGMQSLHIDILGLNKNKRK